MFIRPIRSYYTAIVETFDSHRSFTDAKIHEVFFMNTGSVGMLLILDVLAIPVEGATSSFFSVEDKP